jgi:hypothetical protein
MIKRRLDSKLYIFNFVTLTLGYIGISVLLYLQYVLLSFYATCRKADP